MKCQVRYPHILDDWLAVKLVTCISRDCFSLSATKFAQDMRLPNEDEEELPVEENKEGQDAKAEDGMDSQWNKRMQERLAQMKRELRAPARSTEMVR